MEHFFSPFNFVNELSTLKNKCYIIAGPNGAGKTTFANEFLPIEADCLNFINADFDCSRFISFSTRYTTLWLIHGLCLTLLETSRLSLTNRSFKNETTQ